MDIFDLMELYFPRRKKTVNKLRAIDKENREAAVQKAKEYADSGCRPALKPEDFLNTASVSIPVNQLQGNEDKVIYSVNQLCKIVDGISAVKIENDSYGDDAINFCWFPFSLSNTYIEFYGDFVWELIHRICSDSYLF